MIPRLSLSFILLVSLTEAATYEEQAVTISRDIQARHLPYGTVLSPMYVSPDSNELLTYTRCGDSAIWTGHWLAAEAFRYQVTKSQEALDAIRKGVDGVKLLVDVTGLGLLSRCVVPGDSPASSGPRNEEKNNGEYLAMLPSGSYYWIGNTSRDQYMGVFFGLSVAWESVTDPDIRATISATATKMIDRLLAKDWSVVMPNGDSSTVFWLRPDQELAILQVGRQVNPARFAQTYDDKRRSAGGLDLVIRVESLDEFGSYYKWNLDAITFYTLIHNEEATSSKRNSYLDAYRIFRRTVQNHQNAFFNGIDRALSGPEAHRDAETMDLLAQWLLRPKRDPWVDLRGKYKGCGDNACNPIPVVERVPTDFLWQRSPVQLVGGGTGQIEGAGIDFILPYWMGRATGLDFSLIAVSAASSTKGLAPEGIATIYGTGFAADSKVLVRDSAGIERPATVFYSGPSQVNFVIPAGTAIGPARIRVLKPDGTETHVTTIAIQTVAPALFTANAGGTGVAAATAVQRDSAGKLNDVPVFRCSGPLICVALGLQPADNRPVYLSLYGTGIRGRQSDVRATFNGENVPVEFAGPQGTYAGLDQINLRLERSLRSRGEQDLIVVVDGVASNSVRISVR